MACSRSRVCKKPWMQQRRKPTPESRTSVSTPPAPPWGVFCTLANNPHPPASSFIRYRVEQLQRTWHRHRRHPSQTKQSGLGVRSNGASWTTVKLPDGHSPVTQPHRLTARPEPLSVLSRPDKSLHLHGESRVNASSGRANKRSCPTSHDRTHRCP